MRTRLHLFAHSLDFCYNLWAVFLQNSWDISQTVVRGWSHHMHGVWHPTTAHEVGKLLRCVLVYIFLHTGWISATTEGQCFSKTPGTFPKRLCVDGVTICMEFGTQQQPMRLENCCDAYSSTSFCTQAGSLLYTTLFRSPKLLGHFPNGCAWMESPYAWSLAPNNSP